jgi:hypothetical protein
MWQRGQQRVIIIVPEVLYRSRKEQNGWRLLVYAPIVPPDIISGPLAGIAKAVIFMDQFFLLAELTPFQAHIFRFFFYLDLTC